MTLRIAAYASIGELGMERWDALARSCDAPVFYRSAFLHAFERFPLHPVSERRYVVGEDERGALTFAIPLYVVRDVDPMRLVATHFPHATRLPILLPQVWHCYDTCVLSRELDHASLRAPLDAMASAARETGAAYWGFPYVEADGPLARALETLGLSGCDVDQRFTRDLSGIRDTGEYFAGLRRKVRRNMARYRVNADRAGVATVVLEVEDADLDGFVALARRNAEKYDNADYYRPGLFPDFVRALGRQARVIEHRLDGRLIGAIILLVDDSRIHLWCAGSDYDAVPGVSPFYLSFLAAVGETLRTGKTVLDCGRRNPTFKTRHGMHARTLRAYLTPTAASHPHAGP